MLLISFVVTKHVDAIEVGFIYAVRLITAAFLQDQPASRFRFTTSVLVRSIIVFAVAVESLPSYKLATGAIKNNIARHRKLDLLAINPACRRRGGAGRKSYLVPNLVCFVLVVRLLILPFGFRRS